MKKTDLFYRLGELVYKGRILIVCFWVFLMLGCIPFVPHIMSPFKSTGFVDETSKGYKNAQFLDKELGYRNNQIVISYYSNALRATNSLFKQKIKNSLSKLNKFPMKHDIIYPTNTNKQISKDKHTAFAVISFRTSTPLTQQELSQFKSLLKPPSMMSMKLGGEPIFIDDMNKQTQKDLYKADMVAAPVSIIIMILIFGSLVAALVPIVLGGGCALLILTTLYFIGQAFTLSIFTLNIALLLGLCLSLDYSLFIISRFRNELQKKTSMPHIMGTTLDTAGKAVFFSGLAVFISISVLLIFPINILFSVGVGGLVAVFVAVFVSIIILPAILGILKTNINRLPVRIFKNRHRTGSPFWRGLASTVIKRPLLYFILILCFLLFLGYPFLKVNVGIADAHILPVHSDSRVFFDEYKSKFNENDLSPIQLIITSKNDDILSNSSISKLYDFTKKLKSNPSVSKVNSIVTSDDDLTKKQYNYLYKSSNRNKNTEVKQLLRLTTRDNFTMMGVVSKYPVNSAETKALIAQIEKMNPGRGLTLQVTGVPVNNAEVLSTIKRLFPYALLWIIVLTYVILLILLRSIFLPLKAILMNIISLSASYGVLVFIFQEGYLHEYLNFTPQGMLDTSLLIIIFCALFGFSMDYEVFLLTRIKEFYDKTKDNNKSIIYGIDKSSRIITSAAIIVIFLCGSFMVADVLMVKEFGLGIAVAIFVDAFLVRSILVPSTMVLLKKWNWYLPKWLDRILP